MFNLRLGAQLNRDDIIEQALDAFMRDVTYIEEIVKVGTKIVDKQQRSGQANDLHDTASS